MSYPVKWFYQDMENAPQLKHEAGSFISFLDALLIDGFNSKTVHSITYDAEKDEATVTISGGHGYLLHQIVLIEGANEVEYNGEQRVSWIDGTTFKFTPETAPSGAATGTITVKTAPVGGWEKAFDDGAGTKAAYRSMDPAATGLYLRIDDTNTVTNWDYNNMNLSRMFGCESMTDIDTYTGQWENDDTWMSKGYKSWGDGPATWWLVGDSRLFYWGAQYYRKSNKSNPASYMTAGYAFGDFVSFRPGDAFGAMLIGVRKTIDKSGTAYFADLSSASSKALARKYSQLPGSTWFSMTHSSINAYLGGDSYGLNTPNAADNGVYFHGPLMLREGSSLRGKMPGLLQCLHDRPVANYTVLENVSGVVERKQIAFPCGYNDRTPGQAWFDIAGSWR